MHINYNRGETREQCFRWDSHNPRNRRTRGRKGLLEEAHMLQRHLGVRNWCPCCISPEWQRGSSEHNHRMSRLISKRRRRLNQQVIQAELEEGAYRPPFLPE